MLETGKLSGNSGQKLMDWAMDKVNVRRIQLEERADKLRREQLEKEEQIRKEQLEKEEKIRKEQLEKEEKNKEGAIGARGKKTGT